MPLIFSLGGIPLHGFEVPQELKTVGTKQVHAVTEFPGGAKSIRNLGAFPISPIEWEGMFMGHGALERAMVLERFAGTAQLITLTYGPRSWLGEVIEFEAPVRTQHYVPYKIKFEPLVDLTGIAGGQQSAPSPEAQLQAQQGQLTAQQQGGATTLPAAAGGGQTAPPPGQ